MRSRLTAVLALIGQISKGGVIHDTIHKRNSPVVRIGMRVFYRRLFMELAVINVMGLSYSRCTPSLTWRESFLS